MKRPVLNPKRLPTYQTWQRANGEDFTLLNYLYGVGSIELAIAFTSLFWPETLEHEGGIYLADNFSLEIYQQWADKLGKDLQSMELTANYRHLGDLLPGAGEVSFENICYLGSVLRDMWDCCLSRRYPHRRFSVIYTCAENDADVTITFSQVNTP